MEEPAEGLTLDAMFSQSPLGLQIFDADLRLVRINPATAAMRGRDAGDMAGLPLRELFALEDPDAVEALARSVLEDGRPVLERRVRAFIDPHPAPARTFSVSLFRLRSEAGPVLGLAAAVVDVTEEAAAEAGSQVLDAVRARAGASLDAVDICRELAGVLAGGTADAVVVEVVDAVMTGDDPPLLPAPQFTALHCAAVGRRGTGRGSGPLGSSHVPDAASPAGLALAQGRPVTVTVEGDAAWLHAADHVAALRGAAPVAVLVAPFIVRGTLLGLVSLYRWQGSPSFTQEDTAMAATVTDYVALCLDNSRRYTREHAVAATVARRFLPQAPQPTVGLETAQGHLATHPATGGWYDVIPISSARTALVIGEVDGSGIHTSATMGQLRTALRCLASLDLEPDELLARLDETTRQLAAERRALPAADPLREQSLTASCLCAVYDPVAGTLTVARAGHPGLVLIPPDGSLTDVDLPDVGLPDGPRLGTSETAPFAAARMPVPDGTVVALATPQLFTALGTQGLRDRLVPVGRLLREQCDQALLAAEVAGEAGAVVLLLGRATGLAGDGAVDWVLDADERTPALARRLVRAQLGRWGLPEEVSHTTELLVSELVTNVVRYGRPPCRLGLIHADDLTLEVSDGAASSPHLRHARTTDEGGRGLYIVSQFADRWGVRFTPTGKTVWVEQHVTNGTHPA
ncbi:SpoIIE family protein phosphatase [Streptacidiphilus fuscans]|uniref:SpoIIE family protein phosphatase n=1 Tax=Streptacidiphilus fuscans TaxID=2789292 RepID=A0A931B2K5_9ACTN|nr:SpoIIE family protein phosphatase [Streptacidiphilus fuscans]MBF9069101.1 SpoIIE family protein phosphatase [Streptacidiphilus fuscans]